MKLHILWNHAYTSNAKATLVQSAHKDAKIFENHLNPAMLVFTG